MQIKTLRAFAIFLTAVTAAAGLNLNICAAGGASDNSEGSIDVSLEKYKSHNTSAVYENGALVWNGDGKLDFEFNTDKAGDYELYVTWKPLENGVNPTVSVEIDGETRFDEAKEIELKREWKNVTDEPRRDKAGNEYAQEQVETGEFITTALQDYTGAYEKPFVFSLEPGKHTLTLGGDGQKLSLKAISFNPYKEALPYSENVDSSKLGAINAETVVIEGEDADIKSGNYLIPKSNNSDSGMSPCDSRLSKINYIGGTAWQDPGDYLSWNFKIETAGYYSLAFRFKQSDLINGDSKRRLMIDGRVPFKEAEEIKFSYDSDWKNQTFSDDDGSPYYIYLDSGEHTITLQVTPGDQVEYFNRLSKVVASLGDEYIKIVMITGETPDVNRDYQLFNQIPDFNDTLKKNNDELVSIGEDMKKSSGKRATQIVAAMENMSRVLSSMLRSPYIAQQYVKDYYNNYTSLSSWLYDMTNMPLSLDYMRLVPYGGEQNVKNQGFFKRFSYGFMRLLVSFTDDYTETDSSGDSAKTVRLWVNWGQDQTSALNSLIEDSFTPQTGIHVNLEIVNASLVNGILSGNFPDVSLHMSRTEPVNLGMRGALADLTQFEDYGEVIKRFNANADLPYTYKNAVYALPDTQSFMLMFYRTDILEKLGLDVPNTWQEFLHAATVIQRNNMNVYIPYTQITTSTTVNAGIGSLHLLPTLMLQNNLSFYNEEKTATALNSEEAIKVFQKWTDFYVDYGFNKEADFYNRFRNGVMPLGIAPYSTYLTLYSAAPEIKGRWSVACVPGEENGNKTVAGSGTGCAIIEKSSHKAEAWEFLKWWTSADTQSRYSQNVESVLGMIGRVATSNIEGFKKLAWDSHDEDVILKQWSCVKEIPEVPGSYYLTRSVDQAFWAVVNGNSKAKDAIVKWSDFADDEIARKIKEYS